MISLIEALNYRCLKSISQTMGPFHVLVGPNASGKTTFLDVVAFLGRLVSDGLEAATGERTANFRDLVWARTGDRFELAIEAAIPPELRQKTSHKNCDRIRYEVAIGIERDTGEVQILAERALLKKNAPPAVVQKSLFPEVVAPRKALLTPSRKKGIFTVINKIRDGNDNFYPESGKGYAPTFRLGPLKSTLGNLPDDETNFPVTTWLKSLLTNGIQQLILDSQEIRKPSPSGQARRFKPDGSNIPWVIQKLKDDSPERFREWIAHLQTALPDIKDITTEGRPEDNSRYLVIHYSGDLQVPSWMASDGTLRILALTLPAYLPDFTGTCLIEEPENGIHPKAVEMVFQSLSSVYEAQVLLATHSPIILGIAEPDTVLCFAKTDSGGTDIVSGDEHPKLRDWRGETDLGTLFAAGVLG